MRPDLRDLVDLSSVVREMDFHSDAFKIAVAQAILDGSKNHSAFIHTSTKLSACLKWHKLAQQDRQEHEADQLIVKIDLEELWRAGRLQQEDFINLSTVAARQKFWTKGPVEYNSDVFNDNFATVCQRAEQSKEFLFKWRGRFPLLYWPVVDRAGTQIKAHFHEVVPIEASINKARYCGPRAIAEEHALFSSSAASGSQPGGLPGGSQPGGTLATPSPVAADATPSTRVKKSRQRWSEMEESEEDVRAESEWQRYRAHLAVIRDAPATVQPESEPIRDAPATVRYAPPSVVLKQIAAISPHDCEMQEEEVDYGEEEVDYGEDLPMIPEEGESSSQADNEGSRQPADEEVARPQTEETPVQGSPTADAEQWGKGIVRGAGEDKHPRMFEEKVNENVKEMPIAESDGQKRKLDELADEVSRLEGECLEKMCAFPNKKLQADCAQRYAARIPDRAHAGFNRDMHFEGRLVAWDMSTDKAFSRVREEHKNLQCEHGRLLRELFDRHSLTDAMVEQLHLSEFSNRALSQAVPWLSAKQFPGSQPSSSQERVLRHPKLKEILSNRGFIDLPTCHTGRKASAGVPERELSDAEKHFTDCEWQYWWMRLCGFETPSQLDEFSFSALHHACDSSSFSERAYRAAKALIKVTPVHIIDTATTGKRPPGYTCMHFVCDGSDKGYRHNDLAKSLLDYGAAIDPTTTRDGSPLLLTCATGQSNLAYMLLKHGADTQTINRNGKGVKQVAASSSSTMASMVAPTNAPHTISRSSGRRAGPRPLPAQKALRRAMSNVKQNRR